MTRVLHEVWSMGIGGIETYLMGVARRLGPHGIRMDFLVHDDTPRLYEPEIQAMGGRIFRCPPFRVRPDRLAGYRRALHAAHDAGGPYDIFHSHYEAPGPSLAVARRRGVPVRIAHSHSGMPVLSHRSPWFRAALHPVLRALTRRHATLGFGVSEPAAARRFGAGWKADPRWSLLRCGIDLAPFRGPVDRAAWRARHGIPPDALVMAHIGRFGPEKNHAHLLRVAAAMRQRGMRFRLVVLGDGGPRASLAKRAESLGVASDVLFLGYRTDVPDWLRGAADVLVFPSFHEGLPLSVVEAQACGVPVVMSDRITFEAALVPGLVSRLSLRAPLSAWVEEILRIAADPDRPSAEAAWEIVAESAFNIERAASALEDAYRRATKGTPQASRVFATR